LRRRLEDTSGTPLWDDATLNDLLGDAVHQYGARFPAERTATIAVTAGALSIPVAAVSSGTRIVRVRDGAIRPVERWRWHEDGPGEGLAQAWRWWAGSLALVRPATAGDWEVDYLDKRELPGDDVTPVELVPGDEEIVVLLAAAGALWRRSVEQGKRGLEPAALALSRVAAAYSREAERMMNARRRRAVGAWLD
jgi:hypothetical protein